MARLRQHSHAVLSSTADASNMFWSSCSWYSTAKLLARRRDTQVTATECKLDILFLRMSACKRHDTACAMATASTGTHLLQAQVQASSACRPQPTVVQTKLGGVAVQSSCVVAKDAGFAQ